MEKFCKYNICVIENFSLLYQTYTVVLIEIFSFENLNIKYVIEENYIIIYV